MTTLSHPPVKSDSCYLTVKQLLSRLTITHMSDLFALLCQNNATFWETQTNFLLLPFHQSSAMTFRDDYLNTVACWHVVTLAVNGEIKEE